MRVSAFWFRASISQSRINGSCMIPPVPESGFRVSHSLRVDGARRAEAIVERFRKKHQTVRIPVVYSGVFTVNVFIQGCTRPGCYRYALEESQLLAALPRLAIPLGE